MRSAQYVVLCEGLQAAVFIRRALRAGGVEPRRARLLPLPITPDGSGDGAGDQYVINRYPSELAAWRQKNASVRTRLIVHIDADGNTVASRHAQLASAAEDAGVAGRRPDDPVAELVPKRNIETWIYALDPTLLPGPRVLDESTAYPKMDRDQAACETAAARFAEHAKAGGPPPMAAQVPSLGDGIREFARLRGGASD